LTMDYKPWTIVRQQRCELKHKAAEVLAPTAKKKYK